MLCPCSFNVMLSCCQRGNYFRSTCYVGDPFKCLYGHSTAIAREERTRGVTLADVHGFDAEDPLCSTLTATLQSFAAVTLLHAKLRGLRSPKFYVVLMHLGTIYDNICNLYICVCILVSIYVPFV